MLYSINNEKSTNINANVTFENYKDAIQKLSRVYSDIINEHKEFLITKTQNLTKEILHLTQIFTEFLTYNNLQKDENALQEHTFYNKLDRMTCSLLFTDLYGTCLQFYIDLNLFYFQLFNSAYQQIFTQLDIEDQIYHKNFIESYLNERKKLFDTLKFNFKHVLKSFYMSKKEKFNAWGIFLDKSKTEERHINYIKDNICFVIQISYMLYEYLNAAKYITNIVDEQFKSEKNATSVSIFKKAIKNDILNKGVYTNALQKNYDYFNLASIYFLQRCGYFFSIKDNIFQKTQTSSSKIKKYYRENHSGSYFRKVKVLLTLFFCAMAIGVLIYLKYFRNK
ncbi:hypothetical protein GVAV_000540 [Gurleya vavrai]